MHTFYKNNIEIKARSLALIILNQFSHSEKPLNKIIETQTEIINSMSRKDRALSNQIIYGVLRWRKKLDYTIQSLSKKPISKTNTTILNILRIGLFQLIFMNRIPRYALINTAVEMAKKSERPWASGYVNKILRNAKKKIKIDNHDQNEKFIRDLSVSKSLPEWIIIRWVARFGLKKTKAICNTINTTPKISIRVNTLKTNKKILYEKLKKDSCKIKKKSKITPEAIEISLLKHPIPQIKTFINGMFTVQDCAAQAISHFLNPKSGENILDACAGFGGKSTHIAQLMNNYGSVTALDKMKYKLEKLKIDATRLGITIIKTKCFDLNLKLNEEKLPLFDRILLDAPCSGLGIIRKNPDIKWTSNFSKIYNISQQQKKFLEQISLMTKPSGILVYAVCSTELEETEHVINSFLKINTHFKLNKQIKTISPQIQKFIKKSGFFQINLNNQNNDGFFAASLQRKY